MVPSCIESALSGVMKMNQTYSWYTTKFDVPRAYAQNGRKVLLNFEAVDYQATVYVNGELVGTHTGGYWHFNFDITKYLTSNGENTLHVFVFDPTDAQGTVAASLLVGHALTGVNRLHASRRKADSHAFSYLLHALLGYLADGEFSPERESVQGFAIRKPYHA